MPLGMPIAFALASMGKATTGQRAAATIEYTEFVNALHRPRFLITDRPIKFGIHRA